MLGQPIERVLSRLSHELERPSLPPAAPAPTSIKDTTTKDFRART